MKGILFLVFLLGYICCFSLCRQVRIYFNMQLLEVAELGYF